MDDGFLSVTSVSNTPAVAATATRHLDDVTPSLAIWSRSSRASFRPLFHHLIRNGFDMSTAEGWARGVRLDHLLPEVPSRLVALRRALLRDIHDLAKLYADRSGSHAARIKLEVETTDRCQFFHADNIRLRLLCTYQGPGTEWVPDAAVDRSALGRGGNDGVILDEAAIRRMQTWSVGLFKGDAYPGFNGRGCVHRSPPIEGCRQTRVLLCIDSPTDA
jgi:hypothetical protein